MESSFTVKKRTFGIILVSTHLLFIVLYIHQQNRVTKLSFNKQAKERKLEELQREKKELTQTILALSSHQSAKKFAETKLNMQKLQLSQIRKIPRKDERTV